MLSGDSLLKFSHLIAYGLADYTIVSISHQTILYIPFLTDKGSRIVDAWFSGNRNQVREALGENAME